jgi:hypothetical protein
MKMKLKIKGQNLKRLIDIINSATYPEIRLHFEEDKVWFRWLDLAGVAILQVELSKDAFIEYNLEGEPYTAGLDFGMLHGMKHLIGPIMEVQHYEKFNFSNMIGGGFNLSEVKDSVIKKDPHVPELTLSHQFEVRQSVLKSISFAAKRLSNKLRITSKTGHTMLQTSDCANEVYEELLIGVGEGEVSSLISADYVYNCVRHLTGMIEVRCGDDHPIMMINEPFDGCKVTMLLAPRIESE